MSPERPRLPDIRELRNHDRPRDRSSPAWVLLAAASSVVAVALLTWSARIVGSVATDAGLDARATAAAITAYAVAATWIVALALWRHGRGLIPYLAVIVPLVTWLVVVMVLIVIAGLTGTSPA